MTTIKSLAISPKEDFLVALSSDLLLYSFSMKKKEGSSQKRNMFSILLYPFHSDSIEGLDVCHRKPLVVTCSKDHTIRVWNYRTFGMELAKVKNKDQCYLRLDDFMLVVQRRDFLRVHSPGWTLHCCWFR